MGEYTMNLLNKIQAFIYANIMRRIIFFENKKNMCEAPDFAFLISGQLVQI